MFNPRYLLRFDDLCPTMDSEFWTWWEPVVAETGIKPIAAVVPDNHDPALKVAPPDPEFWSRMRMVQSHGWDIALHGYQHTPLARGRSLVPLYNESEFAGLPEAGQRHRIQSGLHLLHSHGITPTVWVAPRHGFDSITLEVLISLGLDCVSDGFDLYPHRCNGVLWLPQQLWEGHAAYFGVWTICVHPNGMMPSKRDSLAAFLRKHAGEFTTVAQMQVTYSARRRSLLDRAFNWAWQTRVKRRSARIRSCSPVTARWQGPKVGHSSAAEELSMNCGGLNIADED